MIFSPAKLKGAYIIDVNPFSDDRGWFVRYYAKDEFDSIGHTAEWVQINHSHTNRKGTIRGLHFQFRPSREIKLIRCIAGAVYDVIVDLREGSPSFLESISVELSAENRKMIYVPEGFAHGFQALTDHCELLYHHSAAYDKARESGLRYDDPALQITWPLPVTMVSTRDAGHQWLDKNFKGL